MEIPIGYLRRRIAGLLEEPPLRPLAVCPSCESGFVHPQAWKELPSGDLFLRLRCPECQLITSGTFGQDRVAEFDRALIEGKEAARAGYAAVVRHNMEELLARFQVALELDLISAEDFKQIRPKVSRARARAGCG